jgi:ribose/xylose/arabinose/galactoside ABC-type transport system permease subunit
MQPSSSLGSSSPPRSRLSRLMRGNETALLVCFAILIAFFGIVSDTFLTQRNMTNVLGQASFQLIAGVGLALVVISGEIDISIGSLLGAVAIPLVTVMNATGSLELGIVAALVFALCVGAVNGYLVAYVGLNSLIVTLGSLFVIRGLIYVYTGMRPIADEWLLESFYQIGNGRLSGVLPYPAIMAMLIVALFAYILRNRQFGRQVYAVGGNPEVARLAGFDVRRVKFMSFLLCSLLTGIAGVLLASRLGSAVHVTGLNFEFQVVAAIVLGGISLAGGIGSIWGVVLGVLILAFLSNGLGQLKLPTEWQLVITGIIIITAVAIDESRRRRK